MYDYNSYTMVLHCTCIWVTAIANNCCKTPSTEIVIVKFMIHVNFIDLTLLP